MIKKKIVYRLCLLGLSLLVIPAVPIFVIFLGTSSPEYVINGTLNMQVTEELYPLEIYKESLKNLLTFNLGTSTASGLPVIPEVSSAFIESSKIMFPALFLSLFVGVFFLFRMLKRQYRKPYFEWIFFVPMVVSSYILLFIIDRIGFDVMSNVRYYIAILILSIYPSYIVFNSFFKRYKEIVESEFYSFHQAFGFSSKAILKKFLIKPFLIEYLSFFENIFIYMFSFVFFVESPMAINGIGFKFVWSIQRYDYPMIIGFCVFSIIILTIINVITDTLLLRLDKRR